jgi:hypothetical protein
MFWSRITRFTVVFAVAAILTATSPGQEVAFLDLTKMVHRDLRRPKSRVSGNEHYGGVRQVTSCSHSVDNVGALRTSLVSLDRTNYQLEDQPIFELTVENVGPTTLRIPFSSQLADLQPEDAAQKFSYSELQIEVWIAAGDHWATNTGGLVILYGNEGHANTMLTLNGGEWARVIGKGHLFLGNDLATQHMVVYPADQLYAQASLFHVETLITPTQTASVLNEVCISQTHGQGIPIQLTLPQLP